MLVELVMFLCINVSFVIIVYKFVLFVHFVLNVHFVRAVLQPLFVSYLLLICYISSLISLISFIYHFIHVLTQPYSTLILN